MTDINRVVLIGRLTRDAELRQNGTIVSSFSIAVNRKRKQGGEWVDDVSYFDIVAFGKQAESLQEYLTKGKQIAIDGELKQDRWEKDGQNRSKVVVIANSIQLLGGNNSNHENGESHNNHDNGFERGKAW
jgi:single-strand DNA-binding protein